MAAVIVLIVEDDLVIQEHLASQLLKLGFEISDRIDHGEEVLKSIRSKKPDVILMDIKLAGKQDGIETAEEVREHFDIPVIYLTDYSDDRMFEKAKRTSPVNFLPKPYNIINLEHAIELAFHNSSDTDKISGNNQALLKDAYFIKWKQNFVKIKADEIVYLEAGRSYSYLYTTGKMYDFSESLNKLAAQVPHESLVQVSRSYIVNVNNIHKISGNTLYLNSCGDEKQIIVGKTFKKAFFDRMPFIR